jgi:hypothetical protein
MLTSNPQVTPQTTTHVAKPVITTTTDIAADADVSISNELNPGAKRTPMFMKTIQEIFPMMLSNPTSLKAMMTVTIKKKVTTGNRKRMVVIVRLIKRAHHRI